MQYTTHIFNTRSEREQVIEHTTRLVILGSVAGGARKGEFRTRPGLTLGMAVEAREMVREIVDMIM